MYTETFDEENIQITPAKYEILKAESQLPSRDLFRIQDDYGELIASVFGPANYNDNVKEMSKEYFNSRQFPRISFREANTAESIRVLYYLREKLNRGWLQLGKIVRTDKGVFVNPPRNKEGDSIIEEEKLSSLLTRRINDIQTGESYFGFAPYEAFQQYGHEAGKRYEEDFSRSSLARILEYTPKETAERLAEIFHGRRTSIYGFNKTPEPKISIVSVFWNSEMLMITGNEWAEEHGYRGYAIGIVKQNQ